MLSATLQNTQAETHAKRMHYDKVDKAKLW